MSIKIAVLISGTGRTLHNILKYYPVEIVISSNDNIEGNKIATSNNIKLEMTKDSDRIFTLCRWLGIDLVCLAGWLHMLKIPKDFSYKVINIHPSLLPSFGGKGMYGHHVHEAVLKSRVKESGCTVHYVNDEYDKGEIILQKKVPILENDTVETLSAKVFEQECLAYPEAISFIEYYRNCCQ